MTRRGHDERAHCCRGKQGTRQGTHQGARRGPSVRLPHRKGARGQENWSRPRDHDHCAHALPKGLLPDTPKQGPR